MLWRGKIFLAALFLVFPQAVGAFCFEEAGEEFGVPAGLLWAIAKVESGFDPLAEGRNANGSIDVGVMQINSIWFDRLVGVNSETMREPCANVRTGARILAECIDRHGYTWEGIGCYNAISTDKRAAYARRVIKVIETMRSPQAR